MWLLALMAGALSSARPPAGLRSRASIVAADPVDAPSLFKPVRAERLQAAASVRPSPWRHASTPADLAVARADAELRLGGRIAHSPRPLAPPVAASGLGAPRFPTGPPAA
jgi:hypothetical protein